MYINGSSTLKVAVLTVTVSPETVKFPVTVKAPSTARTEPSKVKFSSPFNPLEPVAVIILLLTPLFNPTPPAAEAAVPQDN